MKMSITASTRSYDANLPRDIDERSVVLSKNKERNIRLRKVNI